MARVTQLGQMNQSLAQIQNSLNAASRLQEQAASGKRINKASDDPTGAAISMQLRDQQAANTQYARNADYANGQLATVDSTLQSIFSRLNQVRSNIVATAGSSSEQARSALSARWCSSRGNSRACTTPSTRAVRSSAEPPRWGPWPRTAPSPVTATR